METVTGKQKMRNKTLNKKSQGTRRFFNLASGHTLARNKKTWNKKALTPIIATILLISFAAATSVVVMNLGSAQVEEEAECPVEVGLSFAQIKDADHICFDAAKKELAFTIKNGKNSKVEGLLVNIIGEDGSQSEELAEVVVPKAGTYRGKIAYDLEANGAVVQVEIVPTIVPYDEPQICTEQALIVEEVGEC